MQAIQIQDVNSGTALYGTTLSNFPYGAYLVLNVTGHIQITITSISGPNVVLSGVFFGASSNITVTPSAAALSDGQTQQFSVTSASVQPVSWSINPGGAGTISASTGFYTPPRRLMLIRQ